MYAWVIFCPFIPLLASKIKNWNKIRRYILLHMCTINKDSWDIRHNRQTLLSFSAIFCPFIPLTNQKINILKKWKKNIGDIIILLLSTMNDNRDVWFLRHGVQQVKSFLILDYFLPFHWKIKILELEISSAYTCVPQLAMIWYMVP